MSQNSQYDQQVNSPFSMPASPAMSQLSSFSTNRSHQRSQRQARQQQSMNGNSQQSNNINNTGQRETFDRSESDIFASSPLHYGSESQLFNLRNSTSHSQLEAYRNRADIHTDSRHVRQISMADGSSQQTGMGGDPGAGSQTDNGALLVVWGTDVSVSDCKERFKRFLQYDRFDEQLLEQEDLEVLQKERSNPDQLGTPSTALYLLKLQEISETSDPFLDVNCRHIHNFDTELYRKLVLYPQEVIPTFDMAVNELYFELYPSAVLPHPINIRPHTACINEKKELRALNPDDINQLKTISGMVIRCSTLIPEMRQAFFQCSVCQATRTCEVDRGRISEPSVCTNCNTNHSFQIIHNRSTFIDKQQIKLQESPDEMPCGQTPYTILIYACADLVDKIQPGDRVTITGIYRATPVRVNSKQRNVRAIYRTHLDMVHYQRENENRLHDENSKHSFNNEVIDKLRGMSRQPDIYERLARSIAPKIYEHEDIKKGVLLQLFGGTTKQASADSNVKRRHFRAEINILLCGDPGTSKSQLLRYVYDIVPRGQYTSGKGSSAVGLTAYITRDPDSRQLVLQTGALVLADGGICCIDEFDKMSESTRSILHEVMEQQTLSIAKAGIVCQLNARTSILAAANPVESQWNKNKTIIENIQLPHTLISRFDLIYLLLDPQDDLYDRRLAQHLVSLYYRNGDDEEDDFVPMKDLKDYISYAKNFIQPKITKESSKLLIDSYVDMRRVGTGKGVISAYPRQLESLIRLSEAHARLRLSNEVQREDVEEAIRLHRDAMKQSATDPASGRIDISILTTGISSSNRKRRGELAQALRALLKNKNSGTQSEGAQLQFDFKTIFNELKMGSQLMITREMFEDALRDLQEENFLVAYGGKYIRLLD